MCFGVRAARGSLPNAYSYVLPLVLCCLSALASYLCRWLVLVRAWVQISEDHFSLDFGYPLSPLQAFVAAMSIFDG